MSIANRTILIAALAATSLARRLAMGIPAPYDLDRKSTRLNSSHRT